MPFLPFYMLQHILFSGCTCGTACMQRLFKLSQCLKLHGFLMRLPVARDLCFPHILASAPSPDHTCMLGHCCVVLVTAEHLQGTRVTLCHAGGGSHTTKCRDCSPFCAPSLLAAALSFSAQPNACATSWPATCGPLEPLPSTATRSSRSVIGCVRIHLSLTLCACVLCPHDALHQLVCVLCTRWRASRDML